MDSILPAILPAIFGLVGTIVGGMITNHIANKNNVYQAKRSHMDWLIKNCVDFILPLYTIEQAVNELKALDYNPESRVDCNDKLRNASLELTKAIVPLTFEEQISHVLLKAENLHEECFELCRLLVSPMTIDNNKLIVKSINKVSEICEDIRKNVLEGIKRMIPNFI